MPSATATSSTSSTTWRPPSTWPWGYVDLPPLLPAASLAHDWGLRGFDGDVLIVMDDDRETLERYFEEVEHGGRVEQPYSMPYQHFDVWVCRKPKVDFEEVWPSLRKLGR